jgi:hypothetical protein
MDYGTGSHKFLAKWHGENNLVSGITEAIRYYANPKIQLQIPKTDFRTLSHLQMTCQLYALQYPQSTELLTVVKSRVDNSPCVEVRFAYPFLKIGYCEFILCGTIDLLGLYGKEPCFVDHKTTATWDKDKFLAEFITSPQLKIYRLILDKVAQSSQSNFKVFAGAPALVNGIFISKDGTQFKRSNLIDYPQEDLEEIEYQLTKFCEGIETRVSGRIAKHAWDHNTTMCQASPFGPCQFWRSCSQPDEDSRDEILKRDFQPREGGYDPSTHGE